jgi:hypothetical protein
MAVRTLDGMRVRYIVLPAAARLGAADPASLPLGPVPGACDFVLSVELSDSCVTTAAGRGPMADECAGGAV